MSELIAMGVTPPMTYVPVGDKTVAALLEENAKLRAEVEGLRMQIMAYQRTVQRAASVLGYGTFGADGL